MCVFRFEMCCFLLYIEFHDSRNSLNTKLNFHKIGTVVFMLTVKIFTVTDRRLFNMLTLVLVTTLLYKLATFLLRTSE